MEGLFELIMALIGDGRSSVPGIIIAIVLIIPIIALIVFAIDAIRLATSTRILIKGSVTELPNYPYQIDSVMQFETQGLIRSNIRETVKDPDRFEPAAFKGDDNDAESNATRTYNYDETDGIPAVDRPLFKPKRD